MPAVSISALAESGTCCHDTHNPEYNRRIDEIDDRLAAVEDVTPPGGFLDLTGSGPLSVVNVPAGTRRVRFIWATLITTINWPDVLTTDSIGVQLHGLYNQFPTNPAQRRHTERVVSDGVVELAVSGSQDSVAPTPVDIWIVR